MAFPLLGRRYLPSRLRCLSTVDDFSGHVQKILTEFKVYLQRHIFLPWADCDNVDSRRVYYELACCNNISRPVSGFFGHYLSLLSAISYNDRKNFIWLLRKTLAMLRGEASSELRRPRHEEIRKAPCRKNYLSSWPSLNESDLTASLLHFAVLCCSVNIVEYLIAGMEDVSMFGKEWYLFLPLGFSSTPLWLASFLQQPRIMRLLLNAGASPYEVCNVGSQHGLPRTIFEMCENHQRTRAVLLSRSIMLQQFPVSLPTVILMIAEGSDWMIEFLASTFCWNSDVAKEYSAIHDLMAMPSSRSFLEFPCRSTEDVIHKQTICVRMLVHIIRYWPRSLWSTYNGEHSWIAEIIRDLVRHGAFAYGFTTVSASRKFITHHRNSFAQHNSAAYLQRHSFTRHVSQALACDYVLPSRLVFSALLARCASLQLQPPSGISTVPGPFDMEYPPYSGRMPLTEPEHPQVPFGTPYFWLSLGTAQSLDCPILRELFHCGALPHVESLETVPFSASDQKLHDGPTCQCEGVELSAVQRKMSVIDLTSRTVPSLQSSCRATILNSCQGHGVVPAVNKLSFPRKVIDYLLFNSCRSDARFRH